MAKRTNETAIGTDKAKVRVFFAEVEGNNDSVQEALRTMVSAMSRRVHVISDVTASNTPSGLLSQEAAQEGDESIEEISDADTAEEKTTSLRSPRGSGKKKDRNAALSLVPDLNFRPDAQLNLKDYLAQKTPKNDVETTLAMVYFMQNHMHLAKIGAGHVMTAFKEAGKPIPADLRQTIRNVKSSRMWLNFTDLDDIRTTTQGENYVEHDMGKGE